MSGWMNRIFAHSPARVRAVLVMDSVTVTVIALGAAEFPALTHTPPSLARSLLFYRSLSHTLSVPMFLCAVTDVACSYLVFNSPTSRLLTPPPHRLSGARRNLTLMMTSVTFAQNDPVT